MTYVSVGTGSRKPGTSEDDYSPPAGAIALALECHICIGKQCRYREATYDEKKLPARIVSSAISFITVWALPVRDAMAVLKT
jgi:hypothetical protein